MHIDYHLDMFDVTNASAMALVKVLDILFFSEYAAQVCHVLCLDYQVISRVNLVHVHVVDVAMFAADT